MVAPGLSTPPTGYLHSWNQVSTLATVRAIAESTTSWTRPRDVVTRVMWLNPPGRLVTDDDFVVFEEFPLYHLIVAAGTSIFGSAEIFGRVTSLLFMILGGVGLLRLLSRTTETRATQYTLLLYFTSFPVLYYGQAIMSDIAMIACAIWTVERLDAYRRYGKWQDLALSVFFCVVASLFKSYGVIFALMYLPEMRRTEEANPIVRIAKWASLASLLVLPVVSWHLFASFAHGHHEVVSHSAYEKLNALSSVALYRTTWKMYFRYLGYIPGAVMLIYLFIGQKRASPTWVRHWMWIGVLYMILTADKLLHHDYYFLVIAPPVFWYSAEALRAFEKWAVQRNGNQLRVALFISLVIASNAVCSWKGLEKARRINPDVTACALEISTHTKADEFIATLTGVQRYNALAYYSRRLAINVEGREFPLSRYSRAGARTLVVNLPEDEFNDYDRWIRQQLGKASNAKFNLQDFKGRDRICALYALSG